MELEDFRPEWTKKLEDFHPKEVQTLQKQDQNAYRKAITKKKKKKAQEIDKTEWLTWPAMQNYSFRKRKIED